MDDDFDRRVFLNSVFDAQSAGPGARTYRLRELLNNLAAMLDKGNDEQAASALRDIAHWAHGNPNRA